MQCKHENTTLPVNPDYYSGKDRICSNCGLVSNDGVSWEVPIKSLPTDLPGGSTTCSICDHSGSIPMPPDVSAFRWVCKRCGKVSKDGKKWEPQTVDDLPEATGGPEHGDGPWAKGFDERCGDDPPGGSTPSQYALPPEAKELQDLIEYREMNFAMGNIFKACYRVKDGVDPLYDIRKIIWFAKREEARLMKEGDNV